MAPRSRSPARAKSAAKVSPRARRAPSELPKSMPKLALPASAAADTVPQTWLGRQRRSFGTPFLICITMVYFAQGFRSLASLAIQLFCKETLGLAPATMESLLALSGLPWSAKPLYGLLSDSFPIRGQRRKPFLVLAAAFGVFAWLGLAAVAARGGAVPHVLLLGLLTLSNLSTALSDVVVDAMVAERCVALARSSGGTEGGTEGENALQSLCWGACAVGGLLGSGIGMAFSEAPAPLVLLLTAAAPASVLAASHQLREAHAPADARGLREVRRQVGVLGGALALPSVWRCRWRPLLFFFLQNALVPSTAQAMMFFAVDELGVTPRFLALQGVLAFLCLLLGTFLYQQLVQGRSFPAIFFACQLALAALSLADLALVRRWNLALGVPDAALMLGQDALGTVIGRFTMQPFLVAAARLCPPGSEATLFAFFMSTYNFGNAAAGSLGAALLPLFGVGKGAYEGLPALLAVRSACMLLPLPLIHPLLRGLAGRPVDKAE